MGRPKGSLNKRDNGSLFLTKFEKQVCGSAVTRPSARGWINWGLNNDYPMEQIHALSFESNLQQIQQHQNSAFFYQHDMDCEL